MWGTGAASLRQWHTRVEDLLFSTGIGEDFDTRPGMLPIEPESGSAPGAGDFATDPASAFEQTNLMRGRLVGEGR